MKIETSKNDLWVVVEDPHNPENVIHREARGIIDALQIMAAYLEYNPELSIRAVDDRENEMILRRHKE